MTVVGPAWALDPEVEVFSPESDEAEDDSDRYELRETIACGGTSAIYEAFDRRLKRLTGTELGHDVGRRQRRLVAAARRLERGASAC